MDLEKQIAADAASAAASVPGDRDMQRLRLAALRMVEQQGQVSQLADQLKAASERLNEMRQRELPELMLELGTDSFGLPEFNMDLVRERFVHANIAAEWEEERKEAGFAALEELGAGDLIKIFVECQFGKGEAEVAHEAVAAVEKVIKKHKLEGRAVLENRGVAWNTLTAFVKEQLEKGTALPLEKLGVTMGSVAKLKPRKKGK